jgi:hypothetical protein
MIGLVLLGCGGSKGMPSSGADAAPPATDSAGPAVDGPLPAAPDAGPTRDSSAPTPDAHPPAPKGVLPAGLVGTWNVTRASFTPDGGQAQTYTALLGKLINLTADGTYTFNGAGGSWFVADIVDSDWANWATGPYSNSRKVVLTQTGGQSVDGPLEENDVSIFGFQIIYRPASSPPGHLEIVFGRSKK